MSRLTGDERFEKAAYKAFYALWNRRSDIGLVGNTVNIFTGVRPCCDRVTLTGGIIFCQQLWLHPELSGIGAGIDSFYEYALKWYIMSGTWYHGLACNDRLTVEYTCRGSRVPRRMAKLVRVCDAIRSSS